MITNIEIINIASGEGLTLGEGVSHSFMIDFIDWDTPSVSLEGYRLPYQVGRTLTGAIIGSRKPTIYGYVVADLSHTNVLGMKLEDYYKLQETMIEENKLKLDRLISPFQDIEIKVGEYVLRGRPTAPPKYANKDKENNEVLCAFQLSFECYEPLFRKGSKTIELATIEPRFHFPYDVQAKEKIIFGVIKQQQTMLIVNKGDISVPCIIKIEAKGGSVANPKIVTNTGQFIAFDNIMLEDGDYIIINSKIGEEDAILYDITAGKSRSIIGDKTRGAVFLNVEQGSNFFTYEVEEQYRNNIVITLSFEEQYFNVRGM